MPRAFIVNGRITFAGVRPPRWFASLPKAFVNERTMDIDFVLMREQTEGLFYARRRGIVREKGEAHDTMQITPRGTERISRFAFELTARRKLSAARRV